MSDIFHLILIKPVRYDDNGYLIRWRRAVYPSLALSVLNALAEDCARRRILGPGIRIVVDAYDDQCGLPPVREMIRRIRSAPAGGMVGLVAVHTAQFPHSAVLARRFRAAGVPVVIGGSHVSGCLSTMPDPPPELKEMLSLGVSLFVGEAEGRMEGLLRDAHGGCLKPVYDFGGQPVDLATAILPSRLPVNVEKKIALWMDPVNPVEAGRGCPHKCSFCTVVNVHGRKARARRPEAVAAFIRDAVRRGRTRFLFTDDNFARNTHWRQILEAIVHLREEEGLNFSFVLQVDTLSDRIPGFIPLAARAGCVQVFVGMESINPAALAAVGKIHNAVENYQRFFLAWKRYGVMIMAGYIMGFPDDTPVSVRKDLETIKERLPVDLLYPFILTPLPGSGDHATLRQKGVYLDPDPSRYTTFHATTPHPHMSGETLEALYYESFRIFYDDDHIERILRRHVACGGDLDLLLPFMVVARNAFRLEDVNPAEMGMVRIKPRRERHPAFPVEPLLPFLARRAWEVVSVEWQWWLQWRRLLRMADRARRHPAPADDPALIELLPL